MIDGVGAGRTSCGHLFHRGCLARWLQEQQTCGVCRKPFSRSSHRMFVPETGEEAELQRALVLSLGDKAQAAPAEAPPPVELAATASTSSSAETMWVPNRTGRFGMYADKQVAQEVAAAAEEEARAAEAAAAEEEARAVEAVRRSRRGDIVWVKLHGFPWWPAVMREEAARKKKPPPTLAVCLFHTQERYAQPVEAMRVWDAFPELAAGKLPKIRSKAVTRQWHSALADALETGGAARLLAAADADEAGADEAAEADGRASPLHDEAAAAVAAAVASAAAPEPAALVAALQAEIEAEAPADEFGAAADPAARAAAALAAAEAEGLTLARADTPSGYVHVRHRTGSRTKPFAADMNSSSRHHFLGMFATAEEAALAVARFRASEEYGAADHRAPPTAAEVAAAAAEAVRQAAAEGLTLKTSTDNVTGFYNVVRSRSEAKPFAADVRIDGKVKRLATCICPEQAALAVARFAAHGSVEEPAPAPAEAPAKKPDGRATAAAARAVVTLEQAMTADEAHAAAKAEGLTLRRSENATGFWNVVRGSDSFGNRTKPYQAQLKHEGRQQEPRRLRDAGGGRARHRALRRAAGVRRLRRARVGGRLRLLARARGERRVDCGGVCARAGGGARACASGGARGAATEEISATAGADDGGRGVRGGKGRGADALARRQRDGLSGT